MFASPRQTKADRKGTFKCPDCGHACRVTQNKYITVTYKESYASCTNDHCGGRYVFASEPVRILVPSQTPNARIHLPLAKGVRGLADGQFPLPLIQQKGTKDHGQ